MIAYRDYIDKNLDNAEDSGRIIIRGRGCAIALGTVHSVAYKLTAVRYKVQRATLQILIALCSFSDPK